MADFKINFLVNSRPKDREWQWINVLEAQCKYDLPERFQFQNKLCCKFKTESDRTRTCNPQIRSLMPYPLGHTPSCVIIKSYLYINVEDSVLFVVNILLVSRLYVGKFQRWFFWNPYMYPDLHTCRDSSVGRALDWRSKGPRFDPGSRHFNYWYFQVLNKIILRFNVFIKHQWYSGEHSCLPSSWPGFDSRPSQSIF